MYIVDVGRNLSIISSWLRNVPRLDDAMNRLAPIHIICISLFIYILSVRIPLPIEAVFPAREPEAPVLGLKKSDVAAFLYSLE
jgi:hypothetical protein